MDDDLNVRTDNFVVTRRHMSEGNGWLTVACNSIVFNNKNYWKLLMSCEISIEILLKNMTVATSKFSFHR
jgi:hypothetical protein